VIERGDSARLAFETVAELALRDFECDDAVKACVAGLVDFAQPPAPNRARIS
jgi:hypothetical protein